MSNIPFIMPTIAMSETEFKNSVNGVYRFNPDRYREVVMSTPGVPAEVAELIVKSVVENASHPDGSIDVMKSGYVMGIMMKELADEPLAMSYFEAIRRWVRDLDRLPMYNAETGEVS